MTDNQQLLAEFVQTGSETAFRELVSHYLGLVYAAAVRLVDGDTHLAEDISQTVFADLARMARTLPRDVMLGGWLHRHTCFVASKAMRGERRRLARERQAVEMSALEDHSAENLALVAPVLDEAINQLGAEDRQAILLRFFEQNDFQSVGEALGSSEEAARKRVDRALEKLHSSLTKRGVVLSATILGTTLATGVLTAAPIGLATSISTVVLAGTATGSTGATLTYLKIMSMTKLKIGVITAVIAAGVAIPLAVQHHNATKLREADEALRQQVEQNNRLAQENERLAKQAAQVSAPPPSTTPDQTREVARLRGEVGRLRQTASEIAASKTNGPSALSGLKANPGMWKLIRDQQKLGMGMIYKEFARREKLPTAQGEKLTELLADNVMENIDRITEVLRDGKSVEEMNQVFAAQDAAAMEKVQALLGPDGFAQYKAYTHDIAAYLTAEQFKEKLSGDKTEQETKAKQLRQVMQEETRQALANAGLPADFQPVPALNFINIASETEAEKSLALLDDIYGRAAARAGTFLSPEELGKFGEFRTNAINSSRASLAINRKMMAPGPK